MLPPLEKTLVLERKIFDRELAHSAAKAGGEVLVKARATGLIRNGRGIEGVKLVVQGEPKEVRAKIVIGADGTESQSPRWAGLKSIPPLKNFYTAAQYLMTGIDVIPRICQYHIGWSIAPGGYCWVFPKGDRQANIGLVMWVDPKEKKTAIQYLNDFVAARFPGQVDLVAGGRRNTDHERAAGDGRRWVPGRRRCSAPERPAHRRWDYQRNARRAVRGPGRRRSGSGGRCVGRSF